MNIYLVTSKVTYSRAIIVAPSPEEAKKRRPDGAFWRHDAWHKTQLRRKVGGIFDHVDIVKAPSVDWWPDDLSLIDTTLMARHAESNISEDVWCSEPSTEEREDAKG